MRYILTLTIGLLAAIGAAATTASAHDYHRSHRAVEANHSQAHHKANRRFHHQARKLARYRQRARWDIHRRQSWGRQSWGRRSWGRQSWGGNRSRFVIVISHGGRFRIVRRYH